jgi:nucleoside 2-deoxyribosyltransferase
MKVYLGCTVRGDRSALDVSRFLARRLGERGHEVLTTHLLHDDVDVVESSLSNEEVYRRDVAWLDACDFLVAEASGSTYGVGFEVGYITGCAPRTGQKAFVLYRRERRDSVSRLVSGLAGAHVKVFPYEFFADIDAALAEIDRAVAR